MYTYDGVHSSSVLVENDYCYVKRLQMISLQCPDWIIFKAVRMNHIIHLERLVPEIVESSP